VTQFLDRVHSDDKMAFKDLAEAHGVPEGGCCGFTTPPNPKDYNEGKAIWINESGFYQARTTAARGGGFRGEIVARQRHLT
jgi:hypothetical protein